VITDKGLFLIHCNGHSNNGYLVYGFCMLGQNSQVTNLNNMICTNFKIVLLYFSAIVTNIKAKVLVHLLSFLKFYKHINYLYIILGDLKNQNLNLHYNPLPSSLVQTCFLYLQIHLQKSSRIHA
jgi:hypothetical protein